MTSRRRLLLMLATFWPLVYVLVFLIFPPTRQWLSTHGWRLPHGAPTALSIAAMVLQGLTFVCVGVMSVYYVLHLSRAKHVHESEKLPWTILLMTVGILAGPAYWWLYARKEPTDTSP